MANKTSTLTVELIDDVTKPARSVAQALKDAEAQVKAISAQMSEAGGGTDRLVGSLGKLGASKADVEAVSRAWVDYTKASGLAADSSKWTKSQAGDVRRWERATIDSVRSVIRERRAESDAMRGIAREQNQILQQQVDDQKAIRAKAFSGAGSMVAMGLGYAGITGVKDVAKAAADYSKQRGILSSSAAGDPSEVPFAEGLAAEIARQYPNITPADALEMYHETRAQSAGEGGKVDREKAKRNLGLAARTKTAAAYLGQDFTAADAQSLQKALDSSGRGMDPTAFDKLTDSYIRAKQLYGSAVTAEGFNTAVQNAKAANYSIGDDEFYSKMWARISEGNAARFGNETNQTLSTLVGGHATKQAGQWLFDHGLSDGFTKMGGGAVRIDGLHGSDVLQTSQGEWATTYLGPAIMKTISDDQIKAREAQLRADTLKDNPNAKIDDQALHEKAISALVAAEVQKMGVRGTVADNLTKWIVGDPLINRDAKLMGAGDGRDSNAARAGQNPTVALAELTGAMTNFAAIVGGPAMAPAAHALDSMAHTIANFTQIIADWENANPNMATAASVAAMTAAATASSAAILGVLGNATKLVGLESAAAGLGSLAVGLARLAGPLGILLGILELENTIDPKGNFGGALDPLDKWIKSHQLFGGDKPWEGGRPTPPHTPTPSISSDPFDAAFGKVSALKDATSQPAQMNVNVETGQIDTALAKALQLRAVLKDANADGLRAAASIPTSLPPSLGSTIRGNFSHGGINGE